MTPDTPDPVTPLTAEEVSRLRAEDHRPYWPSSGTECQGCYQSTGRIDGWPCFTARLLATLDAARQPAGAEAGLREARAALLRIEYMTPTDWADGRGESYIAIIRAALQAAPVSGSDGAEAGLLPDEDEPYHDRPESDLTIGEVNARAGWRMAREQVRAALQATPVSIDPKRLVLAMETVTLLTADDAERWGPMVAAEYDRLSHAE